MRNVIPYALVAIPMLAGALAFVLKPDGVRRALLVVTAAIHLALALAALWLRPAVQPGAWIGLDDASLLFLLITSVLFLAAAVYAIVYLRTESAGDHRDPYEESLLFDNAPEAVFTGCLLMFLGTMSLVEISRHLGLTWVGVEATTLASAPLVYFHRHRRSLEAVWKYLMICSVGIALALLGLFALASVESLPSMQFDDVLASAAALPPAWLKAAFILMLVGYGTKMGLAPMHTWLPDAHSEAPSLVSALLSGSLLNCAFLALWRLAQLCFAAGLDRFAQDLLLVLGFVSIALAAVFIVGQRDFKRLLAYSSVENMGILAVGVGLGPAGAAGALLHAVNHSLIKASLFLLAGNLLVLYGSRSTDAVRGACRSVPATARLWLIGLLAIGGMPPFGAFISKFTIFKAALDAGRPWVGVLLLGLVLVVFSAMSGTGLRMVMGAPSPTSGAQQRARPLALWVAPSLVLLACALLLGLFLPDFLAGLIQRASGAAGVWP